LTPSPGAPSSGDQGSIEMISNRTLTGAVAGALILITAGTAAAQSTLRAVMHSDLKIVDPIWTTAYISRNYGYLVYDTLFALDEQLNVQPQMVDS
jgi:peptide/nickel transport system substrate-binding protein